MELNHIDDLKVFVQVVDHGSLAGAGRALQLSPVLVSRRIARLEQTLGVRLLERTTRRMHVTDEGRVFYVRCNRILSELELATQELVPASKEISGTVRVLLPTSMVAYGIMKALNLLLQSYPQLTVQIQLSDKPADVIEGGWDVATHIGAPEDSSHIGRRLGKIVPRLAATPEYLAKHGIPEQPFDISKHQCIRHTYGIAQTYWPIVDSDNQLHKVPIGGQLICHDVISIYTAMCEGVGIGLVPKVVLKKALDEGVLVPVLPDCRLGGSTLYALMPAGRQDIPRIRLVVDWLAEFIQGLDD